MKTSKKRRWRKENNAKKQLEPYAKKKKKRQNYESTANDTSQTAGQEKEQAIDTKKVED